MRTEEIGDFCELSDADIVHLVTLIVTMAQWHRPRELLLCANTEQGTGKHYQSELAIMAGMYECEPSEGEKNQQVLEKIIDTAHGAGACCLDYAAKFLQLFRGAPALTPVPTRGWAEVIFDIALYGSLGYAGLTALLLVCKTWHQALNVEVREDFIKAMEDFEKRPKSTWDLAALLCLFVVTRWHGMQHIGTLLLFVGIMSMQLAADWPYMNSMSYWMYGELQQCFAATTADFCQNRLQTLKYFAAFIYVWMVRLFIVASLIDIMQMLVVRLRNTKILNPQDLVFHTPYCLYMCALYVATDKLHSRFVPGSFIHLINTLVFATCGIRTFLPRFKSGIPQKSSLRSMYVARVVCLFVVLTDVIVCSMAGFTSWATHLLDSYVAQFGILYFHLTAFYLAEILVSAFQ